MLKKYRYITLTVSITVISLGSKALLVSPLNNSNS